MQENYEIIVRTIIFLFMHYNPKWQTTEMQIRIKIFTGFPAQIIQHEIDHCDGILI